MNIHDSYEGRVAMLEEENELLRKKLEEAEIQLDAQKNEIRRLHSVIRELHSEIHDVGNDAGKDN